MIGKHLEAVYPELAFAFQILHNSCNVLLLFHVYQGMYMVFVRVDEIEVNVFVFSIFPEMLQKISTKGMWDVICPVFNTPYAM
jgi:hypothetical protein